MLNYIWGGMLIIGIIVSLFTGNIPQITNTALSSSKEAVELALELLGTLCMWSGFMKIAEKSGLIDILSIKMRPLLKFLFPEIPAKSKALNYISLNMIANLLGVGWAATPAGLNAMAELQKLNKVKDTASISMCTFMIINMSSVQLITFSILAYRAKYNSANPSEIIGPGILATTLSTIVAIIYAKVMSRWYKV